MEKKSFGTAANGAEYSLYSFTNKNNVTMVLTDLGATLVSVLVPDKDGVLRDVVLGYDTPQGYLDHTCFFGTVIGRSGNRIDKSISWRSMITRTICTAARMVMTSGNGR